MDDATSRKLIILSNGRPAESRSKLDWAMGTRRAETKELGGKKYLRYLTIEAKQTGGGENFLLLLVLTTD